MTMGVSTYLLNGSEDDEALLATLVLVGQSGNVVTGCAVAERIAAHAAGEPMVSIQQPPEGFDQLTQREQEVLTLIAQGLPDKEVAQQLSIHYRTVETHVTSLTRKLNARTRIRLGVLAKEAGLGKDELCPW
jgi:DNA-binding NarL/FixJ family response regulator